MLLKDLLEVWLLEKRNYIKTSTYAYYLFEIEKYIIPILGNKTLENITEKDIQNAVLKWQKDGIPNGHPLKKSTVQNLVVLINQVFKYAVKKNILDNYLLEIQFVPQPQKTRIQTFNQREQKCLTQAVLNDLSYKSFGILLCLNSGLRIGELCALKWSDIDMSRKIIHIDKTIQRIYISDSQPRTKIIISAPKTDMSIRDIPLSDKISSVINKFNDICENGYILSNSIQYVEPRTFRRFYKTFLLKHNVEVLNFHCLRHTFATQCIENGADYKSVSEILGHSTVNTTLNMYVHPSMEEKKKCVDMIQWD